ncbi:MAG: hypothetical protein HGB08_03595 [Candidatus Moranbacteria bacterium]|nr:hypothetical protein [Candidatus Moranbacteria bacterium]
MNSNDGFFAIMIMILSLLIFWTPDSNERKAVEKPAMSKPTAEIMPPARLPERSEASMTVEDARLENHALLPGEGDPVTLPSMEYAESIRTDACPKINGPARNDCERRISEVLNGYCDISSRIDPPYGRPPLTEPQFQHIRSGAKRTIQLLKTAKYYFLPTSNQEN